MISLIVLKSYISSTMRSILLPSPYTSTTWIRLMMLILCLSCWIEPSTALRGIVTAASSQAAASRRLEDGNSQDNNEDNEEEEEDKNADNNDDDASDSDSGFLANIFNRVTQDMSDMWTSAPNTWISEYWEVFVVITVSAFILLGLHVCMAYDLCCGGGARYNNDGNPNAGFRKTMTPQQIANERSPKQRATQQLLQDEERARMRRGEGGGENDPEWAVSQHEEGGEESGNDSEDDAVMRDRNNTPTKSRQQVARKIDWNRVGKEVVSVWSEFLGYSRGSVKPKEGGNDNNDAAADADADAYRRHEDTDDENIERTLSKVHSSGGTSRPSRRSRSAPRRKHRSTAAAAAASSSSPKSTRSKPAAAAAASAPSTLISSSSKRNKDDDTDDDDDDDMEGNYPVLV